MGESDIKKSIEKADKETRRHFGVIVEDLKSEIQTVAEQVGANTTTLHVIQTDIELIKKDLKQKVDYEDFAALEDRVRQLETIRCSCNSS